MYYPREDSYFLSETLKKFFKNKPSEDKQFCDMGSGSGIQAETLLKFTKKENITCVDLDKQALETLNKKGFKAIKSDLFSDTKEKFDFIIFNPPYLPEDKLDKKIDTSGGKKGDETILEFLKQSKDHIKPKGKIILLLSSLTPQRKIKNFLDKNCSYKKLATKKLFFETLYILIISFL